VSLVSKKTVIGAHRLSVSLSSPVACFLSFFRLPSWFEDHRNVVIVILLKLKIHKCKSYIRHLLLALRGNLEESFSNKLDTYATGGLRFAFAFAE
jgi:hypothetical protein